MKGTINAVSQKEGKYGIRIGNTWYNGFGMAPGQKNDEIEFEYKDNNGFHNILKVISVNGQKYVKPIKQEINQTKMVQAQKTLDIAHMSRLKNATNARMCALNNATQLAIARNEDGIPIDSVLNEANEFVKFIEDVV